MARMRQAKQAIRQALEDPLWRSRLDTIVEGGQTSVGPLFSLLLLDPLMRHKAAWALGLTVASIARHEAEKGRNVVRRYMWHLSEESGNIGWGIPEACAETLVASPLLCREFHKILITYVIDLGREDNFCDNDLLRRSCYWACGRFAEARPELCGGWRPWLLRGLEDCDVICRGMAAWALSRLPRDLMDVPHLRRLAEAGNEELCTLFDGQRLYEKSVRQLALEALA